MLARASNWLLAAALLAMLAWAWARKASYERGAAFRIACLSILAAVTLSKVFSPQYLVWAVPLLLLLAADVLDKRAFITMTSGIILVSLLTTAVFPYLFFEQGGSRLNYVDFNPYALVPNLHPLPCALLTLRNLAWLGAVAWVARAALAQRVAAVQIEFDLPPYGQARPSANAPVMPVALPIVGQSEPMSSVD